MFPLRARDLLAGLRSSVSARAGKDPPYQRSGAILSCSREILQNPTVVSHVYAAADDCAIDDEAAWRCGQSRARHNQER